VIPFPLLTNLTGGAPRAPHGTVSSGRHLSSRRCERMSLSERRGKIRSRSFHPHPLRLFAAQLLICIGLAPRPEAPASGQARECLTNPNDVGRRRNLGLYFG
jgi:hypothetical protein